MMLYYGIILWAQRDVLTFSIIFQKISRGMVTNGVLKQNVRKNKVLFFPHFRCGGCISSCFLYTLQHCLWNKRQETCKRDLLKAIKILLQPPFLSRYFTCNHLMTVWCRDIADLNCNLWAGALWVKRWGTKGWIVSFKEPFSRVPLCGRALEHPHPHQHNAKAGGCWQPFSLPWPFPPASLLFPHSAGICCCGQGSLTCSALALSRVWTHRVPSLAASRSCHCASHMPCTSLKPWGV